MQIQLYGKKIWIFKSPVNFNKAIDGLTTLVANDIKQNPQQDIFLFFNKCKDKVKLLSWHKNGFILFYKRLERGKFAFDFNQANGIIEVNIDELGWLLAGLEWQKMRGWKELSYDKFS